ncbi:ComC/BlpC family leader-containing pheromone/bacteriocin [Tepidibacter thalassicus]|uniref:Bacteriocin-type signal sequence-containing protein n=1 Tax=Tepidibacter thalassicus DSM 15285 TaxID=1123350 RepID=A0A1M5QU89_9FIRM|nr:Blp family class II bacteriocin [Tepidibacter thalassicus]SHH17652.1 bacteriocin-type signal sequence-containing protein [Tepidibacter thalassicus DSM 15285]
MEMTLNINSFNELTNDELMLVNGGEWSWGAFFGSVFKGMEKGYHDADPNATTKVPYIGEVPAPIVGALVGGIHGAIDYLVCGWW